MTDPQKGMTTCDRCKERGRLLVPVHGAKDERLDWCVPCVRVAFGDDVADQAEGFALLGSCSGTVIL